MSAGSAGALVCGFFDLAGGLGGLAWELGDRGGLLLLGEEVRAADVDVSADDDVTRTTLTAAGEKVEASLAPRVEPVAPGGPAGAKPPGGKVEMALCFAAVQGPGGRSAQCAGHLSRWQRNPAGEGTFRHLAVEAPEGALVLAVSIGPPGAAHGEEEAAAWLLDAEGGHTAFGESLLSTQYDEAGRQTRVGLELWPAGEEQTSRAAATRGAGTRLGGTDAGEAGVSGALLRCSVEGSAGLGSYLIARG